jgi:hypothetical protein
MVAGIGFTVALFVSTAAFPLSKYPQTTLDAVKMGALASFFASAVAFIGARMLGIRAVLPAASEEHAHPEETDGQQPDGWEPDGWDPDDWEPDGDEPSETSVTCAV